MESLKSFAMFVSGKRKLPGIHQLMSAKTLLRNRKIQALILERLKISFPNDFQITIYSNLSGRGTFCGLYKLGGIK